MPLRRKVVLRGNNINCPKTEFGPCNSVGNCNYVSCELCFSVSVSEAILKLTAALALSSALPGPAVAA